MRIENGWACPYVGLPCVAAKCGDRIIVGAEQCDDGNFDLGDGCTPFCAIEPDCSKGACVEVRRRHSARRREVRRRKYAERHTDAGHETCDDGVNTTVYDAAGNGCGTGCVEPPHCGDKIITAPEETCDDGVNDGSYGGCTPTCQLGPRCGDHKVQKQFGEECDAGPAGSATCTPTCRTNVPQ